jgi:protocatechuate 3,4-dioxygenase beta subunit
MSHDHSHDHDHELGPEHAARTEKFRGLLRRREALGLLGAGVAGLYGLRSLTLSSEAASAACLLQREVTEGPYYLDLDLVRRNITGDKSGTPLTLRFQVVNANTCKPITNATVEIWHCDAMGEYSGVEGNGGTFLRGAQKTNSSGRVRFESIVPGWYRGRTPHIHMKVFVGGDEVHTGQVFFRTAVLTAVYSQGVYKSRGLADTSNASDNIYGSAGSRALLSMKRNGTTVSSGYTGSLVIGVDPS